MFHVLAVHIDAVDADVDVLARAKILIFHTASERTSMQKHTRDQKARETRQKT